MSRIDTANNVRLIQAGWPPRAYGNWGERAMRDIAEGWCGGDREAAGWVLSSWWVRERSWRWLRAASVVSSAFLILGPTWIAVLTVPVALVITRTGHDWAYVLGKDWHRQEPWKARVIAKFGSSLPAAVLSDEKTRRTLLEGLDPDTESAVVSLAPEWEGSVADLVTAARVL